MVMRNWFPIALVALFVLFLPGLFLFSADLMGYEAEINAWLESHFSISHHMPLALWAAIALFCVPIALLILYFLKLKRKPLAVPSTFLWKKSIEDLHVNRLLQWLRRNILLVLQLLIILSLIYAVLAPRLHGTNSTGKHYILIIDNSASMTAIDISPNRLEWAKAEAIKEIEAATDEDFGMVIVFNSSAEIRQSYTSNRGLLRRAVEGIQPTNHPTKLEEALTLAESLANPSRSTENESVRPLDAEPGKERTYATAEGIPTEVHLYSDGRFADVTDFSLANLQMNFHVPGTPASGNADNIGIVRLDAIRDEADPTMLQIYVRLMNFRNQIASGMVHLDVIGRGNRTLDARQKSFYIPARVIEPPVEEGEQKKPGRDLPGEQTVVFELTNIAENADVTLHVKIGNAKDAFQQDDQAWLVLGILRKAKVLIVGPHNPVLRYFFEGTTTQTVCDVTWIERESLKDRAKYLDPAQSGEFDLVIFDRCAPETEDEMPRANTFFIGYPPPPWKMEKQEGVADNMIVEKVVFPAVRGWSDQHPVMRGLRGWHEMEIAEAFRMNNLPPRTPRLLEGSGDLVLMATLSRQAYTDLILCFPIETTDGKWNTRWFIKPVFPLFLRNLIYSLGNIRDTASEESVVPGQIKLLRPSGSVSEMRITAPSGTSTKLERGSRADFAYGNTDELGVYEAKWEEAARRFTVNLFDPEESNIDPRIQIQIGSEQINAGENRKQPRELWRWAVLAGFLFVLTEWWIYNRRVHV